MNKIYRLIWNTTTNTWVVASELASARKKTGGRTRVGAAMVAMTAMLGATNLWAAEHVIDNETDITKASGTLLSPGTWSPAFTPASGDTLTINNSGNLSTTGTGTGIDAVVAGDSIVTVTNEGIITSAGRGINAQGGTVEVHNLGAITSTTSGYKVPAIAANATGAGGVVLTSHADITSGAIGIQIASTSGKIDATISGNLVAGTNTGQNWGQGISAHASANSAHVNFTSGSITTKTGNGDAIAVSANGAGNTASVKTGAGTRIDTAGYSAHGIIVTSDFGNAEVVNNSTITTEGELARGIRAQVTGKDSIGNVRVESHGDIATLHPPSPKFTQTDAIQAATVNGNVTVIADGHLSTAGYRSDGIEATSIGGNVKVDFTSGSITTTGSASNAIIATSHTGEVDVTASGIFKTSGLTVDGLAMGVLATTGGLVSGWSDKAGKDAKVTFLGGSIETSAIESAGIHVAALGVTGNAVVDNAASIKTSGKNSAGLYALSQHGGITITNSGRIETVGDSGTSTHGYENSAAGIYANVRNLTAQGGSIDITNSGTIITEGTASHGIHAIQSAGTSTLSGDIDVENNGSITVNGIGTATNAVMGIRAENFGSGDTKVIGNGDIAMTNVDNVDGHAVYAYAERGGSATIEYSGDITTKAENSVGLHAFASGTGDASITYTGNRIEVAGHNSDALQAYSRGGAATVTAQGELITRSNEGTGLYSYGLASLTGGGDVKATFIGESSKIDVDGQSAAILALSDYAGGTGLGTVTVMNEGTLIARATGGRGIHTSSSSGTQVIVNSGDITTMGDNGVGILAASTGGLIDITNTGDITTSGVSSHAINAAQKSETGSGSVNVTNNGTITVNGTGASPDGVVGVRAQNFGTGNVSVAGSGDVTMTNVANKYGHAVYGFASAGNVSIDYSGNISTEGEDASGIRAMAYGAGDAVATYTGDRIEVSGQNADAILVYSASGNSKVSAQGHLITHADAGAGEWAYGIAALTSGGDVEAVFTGSKIEVDGDSAAILAQSNYPTMTGSLGSGAGAVKVENSGELVAYADNGRGIDARSRAGNQSITNSGAIKVQGDNAKGVAAASTDGLIYIANTGAITASGDTSYGITATAGQGGVKVAHGAAAIVADGVDSFGINAISQTKVAVSNDAAGTIQGGSVDGAGIRTAGLAQTIENAGVVGAMNDRAIVLDGSAVVGAVEVTNAATGSITGTVNAVASTVAMTNAGTWNLRDFADTDGDGVRDTFAVAVSDFGTSGSNAITHTGVLNLPGHGESAATLDNSGQYLPLGNAFNAMALDGATQGHIVGVQTFDHAGVIDLQSNPKVGDVLVITGGHAAGTDGGGVFISNGGTLKLDTVLNEGGANSQSDMLVVDSVQVGSQGPTSIIVNNVGGGGAMTASDGIAVVEVLNKDASAAEAFALSGRAVAGIYEYFLHQGGNGSTGGDPADGNWYLRSQLQPLEPTCEETNTCGLPIEPTCEETNTCPVPFPSPIYRPEPGAYLGNQTAALGMLQHTLHDRLGEVDFTERQRGEDDDRHGAAWVRVVRDQFDTTTGLSQIEMGTDTSLLHMGTELGRWTDGDSRFHVGIMGGFGRANTNVGSHVTGYRAKGTVDAKLIGLYGTWYANAAEPTGLYVDTWMQAGRFDNTVEGDYLARERYRSNAVAASVEAGYAIEAGRGERSAFYLEPVAQAIFSDYEADDHLEANGSRVQTGEGGGLTTRLGVRAYTRPLTDMHNRVQPFVEANWWHHSDEQSVLFSGEELVQNRPADVYELKLGVQAEMSRRLTSWAHIGFQDAAGEYRNVQGQVGIKYSW